MNTSLNNIISIIVSAVDPEKIILFGSRARRENTAVSDYDLLVIKNNIKNERSYSRKIYRSMLDNSVTVPVDVIVAENKKIKKNKKDLSLIYSRVISEGKEIYVKKRN